MEALALRGLLEMAVVTLAAEVAGAIREAAVLLLAAAALVDHQLTAQVQQVQPILVAAEVLALVVLHRAVMVLVAVLELLLFMYLQVVTRELIPMRQYRLAGVTQY
jgi:hypothetical protein